MDLGRARRDQRAQGGKGLTVLQPAQLLDRADRNVTARTDAEASAGIAIGPEGAEQIVAEVAFRPSVVEHKFATAPERASVSSSLMWVPLTCSPAVPRRQ